MSVYTELSTSDFQRVLQDYSIGELSVYEGIASGIENTNYKITLDTGQQYFLTIFEQLSTADLDFFIPLLDTLKHAGCLLPAPIVQTNGDFLFEFANKSGAIFECLSGAHIHTVESNLCHTIGKELAKIHLAASAIKTPPKNQRGYDWLLEKEMNDGIHLNPDELAVFKQHFSQVTAQWPTLQALPKGFIHGDLFTDNCLFDGARLTGVIDFYAGGEDFWVYDLAICLIAWCANEKNRMDERLKQSLIAGYETVRPLLPMEDNALPIFINLAVLRFWVSRLIAKESQQGVSITTLKDPNAMKQLLVNLNS